MNGRHCGSGTSKRTRSSASVSRRVQTGSTIHGAWGCVGMSARSAAGRAKDNCVGRTTDEPELNDSPVKDRHESVSEQGAGDPSCSVSASEQRKPER